MSMITRERFDPDELHHWEMIGTDTNSLYSYIERPQDDLEAFMKEKAHIDDVLAGRHTPPLTLDTITQADVDAMSTPSALRSIRDYGKGADLSKGEKVMYAAFMSPMLALDGLKKVAKIKGRFSRENNE